MTTKRTEGWELPRVAPGSGSGPLGGRTAVARGTGAPSPDGREGSSPCGLRSLARVGARLGCVALLALGGCKRHDNRVSAEHVTVAEEARDLAERVQPGPRRPEDRDQPRSLAVANPYQDDARAIQEGRRLFRWMNCSGCHAEGGGSIGPVLWDDQWRYGGRGVDIAESILYGRPDGMPAFAGHLPEDQVWKIVAYVQSLEPRGGPYHAGIK